MDIDYVEALASHGINLTKSGSQGIGTCPLCDDAGSGEHLYVNLEKGLWDCKRCHEKGNLYDFLRLFLEISRVSTSDDDWKEISKNRGIPIPYMKMWGLAKSVTTGDWILPGYNTSGKLANLYRYMTLRGNDKPRMCSTKGCKLHPFGTHLLPGNAEGVSTNKRHSFNTVWVCEGPWDGMAWTSILGSFRPAKTQHTNQSLAFFGNDALTPNQLIKMKGCLGCTANPNDCLECLNTSKSLLSTHRIIAVPGAANFPPEWSEYFKDRDVYLLYDNDHPKRTNTGKSIMSGWDGMKKVIATLEKPRNTDRPKKLFRLRWGQKGFDPDRSSGYDIRDLIQENGTLAALRTVLSLSEEVTLALPNATEKANAKPVAPEDSENLIEPIECTSYEKLLKAYKKALHVTEPLEHTLSTMLACVASTTLGGDQLWLRIIGPPGSGKSTLAEAIAPSRFVLARSRFTGLHSGYVKDPSDAESPDASLIPWLRGRTMIVKDADTLMQSPNVAQILSELRDVYDGTSRAQFRNLQTKVYDGIYTTFILCGTDALRGLNRTMLGERFLDCEILGTTDPKTFLDRALENTLDRIGDSLSSRKNEEATPQSMEYLKKITVGFIEYLRAKVSTLEEIPRIDTGHATKVKALGQILAAMRARVQRDRGDLEYRPRVELATRIVSQLSKLAVSLSIVFGSKKIDNRIVGILTKVVLDSATGFNLEITRSLLQEREGLSSSQIAFAINLPETTVRRYLADMQELNIVARNSRPNRSGIRGRYIHLWTVSDDIRSLWKKAGL